MIRAPTVREGLRRLRVFADRFGKSRAHSPTRPRADAPTRLPSPHTPDHPTSKPRADAWGSVHRVAMNRAPTVREGLRRTPVFAEHRSSPIDSARVVPTRRRAHAPTRPRACRCRTRPLTCAPTRLPSPHTPDHPTSKPRADAWGSVHRNAMNRAPTVREGLRRKPVLADRFGKRCAHSPARRRARRLHIQTPCLRVGLGSDHRAHAPALAAHARSPHIQTPC